MGRATIEEGPITIAYGWDHMTGYFLSVTDSRLFFDHENAKEEVNNIVQKVTGMAGYFDLHTTPPGIGHLVHLKTLLEFWKRYGVPEAHIHRAQLGQGVPQAEMELDGVSTRSTTVNIRK